MNGYDESTDCILGRGKPSHYGYARVSINNKLYLAHRVAYEQVFGKIPEGFHVHHKCETKMCINTNHLIALSPEEHKQIHTYPKSLAAMAARTTCVKGHVFDGENSKSRTCSTCSADIKRRWYEQNREKHNASVRAYKLRKRSAIL